MDLPLRSRLLIALVGIVTLWGLLTIVTGSFLINRMIIREAQRRVELALKTADAMLQRRLEEALKACVVMADKNAVQWMASPEAAAQGILEDLRRKCGYDFLHVLDDQGVIRATARGKARALRVEDSPVVRRVLREGSPAASWRRRTPAASSNTREPDGRNLPRWWAMPDKEGEWKRYCSNTLWPSPEKGD